MNVNPPEENVVSDFYDNYFETQKEILVIEISKTRNKLISVAVVIFVFDLLALMMADALSFQTLLWVSLIPAIIIGLAFFATREPLAAIILGSAIIIGLWAHAIFITGGLAAISGWLGKAIIIYLLIAGFQNAREATRIRKEIKGQI